MTDSRASTIPSPGVGARRRGPVALPRLPLSAFTPPNSGTSERFPLPPTPSLNHPNTVIDTCLSADDVKGWSTQQIGNLSGVVLSWSAADADRETAIDYFKKSHPSLKLMSIIVPISLESGAPAEMPKFGDDIHVTLSISFIKNSPGLVEGIRWALEKGYVLDISVPSPGEKFEALGELLTAVFGTKETAIKAAPGSAILLSNLLPPPVDLNVSIVKLMTQQSYYDYQSCIAALSLYPSVYIKYTPPQWDTSIPAASNGAAEESQEKKEWKRRIKTFLGPAIEAFGFERMVYGSSNASRSASGSGNPNDWYEIAHESLAELGVDQGAVDSVFGAAAKTVYNATN